MPGLLWIHPARSLMRSFCVRSRGGSSGKYLKRTTLGALSTNHCSQASAAARQAASVFGQKPERQPPPERVADQMDRPAPQLAQGTGELVDRTFETPLRMGKPARVVPGERERPDRSLARKQRGHAAERLGVAEKSVQKDKRRKLAVVSPEERAMASQPLRRRSGHEISLARRRAASTCSCQR